MSNTSWQEALLGLAVLMCLVFLIENWEFSAIGGAGLLSWWVYKLWWNSPKQLELREKARTHDMYDAVLAQLGIEKGHDPEKLKIEWGQSLYAKLPTTHDDLENELIVAALEIYDAEDFDWGVSAPPAICNSVEGARYRDYLSQFSVKAANPNAKNIARNVVVESYSNFLGVLPELADAEGEEWGTVALNELGSTNAAVEEIILPFFGEEARQHNLFKGLTQTLDRNICEASGIPYSPANAHAPELVLPSEYVGDDVAERYLKHTPLLDIFHSRLSFRVPEHIRYEHTMVVGGTGHGKTTLLADMILGDIEKAKNGGGGFAVIDPKGTLVEQIASLDCFSPVVGDLSDRLIIIDPKRDVEYPPALNMFDLGLDDTDSLDLADRLTMRNNALEMIEYMFSELLKVEMTGRQDVAFSYVGDLMMQIPGATILTLLDFLNNPRNYADAIAACDHTTRAYLENQFVTDRFKAVRDQLSDRVYGVLKLPMMESMFAHSKTKVNLAAAVNEGKIILINANENFLSTSGSSVFGSVWIGLMFQACLSRVTVPEDERLGFTLYVDEASMYFSEKLRQLLVKAREFRLGVVFAFQDLEMIESPQLRASALGSTSTKLVGGLNAKDRRTMAAEMNTSEAFLRRPRKNQKAMTTEFACSVRGITDEPVVLSYQLGKLANQPKMLADEFELLVEQNRARVSHGRTSPVVDSSPHESEEPIYNGASEEIADSEVGESQSDAVEITNAPFDTDFTTQEGD